VDLNDGNRVDLHHGNSVDLNGGNWVDLIHGNSASSLTVVVLKDCMISTHVKWCPIHRATIENAIVALAARLTIGATI